jgi:hypothetical protein
MGYARVRVSVRFLRLGRLQMDELLAHYKHAQAFPARRAPGEIGVSLTLDDAFDVEWLAGFVERHELPEAERDMFVSLLTNYDTRIVAVPKVASELHKRIGGELVLSFTYADEDDDLPSAD